MNDLSSSTRANYNPTSNEWQRLRSHFAFSKMPFSKGMLASGMFDSISQRELVHGLKMWTEVRGLCLLTGPSGVGKSISLRRFAQQVDSTRFRIIEFSYLPSTISGFLRSLNRSLGLPMRAYTSDMFDSAQQHLATYEKEHGPHPILLIDDAEGLRTEVLDTIRRLTTYELDSDDKFSLVLSGTDAIIPLLAHSCLASMRSRFLFTTALRPFGFEDTLQYVRFHLKRSDLDPGLFSEAAIKRLFQASQGRPRNINQLAVQAFIQAAVQGVHTIEGDFMNRLVASHPLYQNQGTES
jgi:type II secretory pathway predicted ATPase ExeA